ncbi:MAG: HPr family phosphocarrier protein [Pseudomonadota bacterium]|nr:HPr family phosphocarrier protein [Pseudomonadota bacterium]
MSCSVRVRINNRRGLHARAAARFAAEANKFNAKITVRRGTLDVDGGSIMDLMLLAASKDTELTITAEGPQATEVLAALAYLIESGFGEA